MSKYRAYMIVQYVVNYACTVALTICDRLTTLQSGQLAGGGGH